MAEDPAMWLPRLLEQKWDAAAKSLGAEGVTLPKGPKPMIGYGGSQKMQIVRASGGAVVKVYQVGPESTNPHSWGMNIAGSHAQWSIGIINLGAGTRVSFP